MFSLFKLLPLELLDRLCSYLKAEDILTLSKILPTVTHCPRYKRLMGKTRCFNRMWNEIAEYREIHENCIHVCLPEITVNPHNDHDAYMEDEDSLLCYFHGRSIFCLAANELSGEIDSRYGKQIVPLKNIFIAIVRRLKIKIYFVKCMKILKITKNLLVLENEAPMEGMLKLKIQRL